METKLTHVNEVQVALLPGMEVDTDGVFEFISFKGCCIYLFEAEDAGTLYVGPFVVSTPAGDWEVDTLQEAAETIIKQIN